MSLGQTPGAVSFLEFSQSLIYDAEAKATFDADPDGILTAAGFDDFSPDEARTAMEHLADALPAPVAAQIEVADEDQPAADVMAQVSNIAAIDVSAAQEEWNLQSAQYDADLTDIDVDTSAEARPVPTPVDETDDQDVDQLDDDFDADFEFGGGDATQAPGVPVPDTAIDVETDEPDPGLEPFEPQEVLEDTDFGLPDPANSLDEAATASSDEADLDD